MQLGPWRADARSLRPAAAAGEHSQTVGSHAGQTGLTEMLQAQPSGWCAPRCGQAPYLAHNGLQLPGRVYCGVALADQRDEHQGGERSSVVRHPQTAA